jgi:hypothetical protein
MPRIKDEPQLNEEIPQMNSQGSDFKKTLSVPVLVILVAGILSCILFALLASKDKQHVETTPIATATFVSTQPVPTAIIPPPTATVALPPASFSDEFEKGLSNYWAYFVALGDKKDVDIAAQGQHIRFSITERDTYAYLIYELQQYEDVQIETEVINQGTNNNNVGLICRFSEDGWYEFNVSSSGIYQIYAFDNNEYRLIRNGGSTLIHMGQDANVYRAECIGNALSLFVNDEQVWSGQDNTFKSGMIGLSASTKMSIPVKIDFEWITVTANAK